ncbi:Oligomerization domain-containing protein [Mucor mucedo]|uniref:Oligomerization domain-containing protein n=1 Tax=Mucor mucedo TaxID=29922 RepID=UPI002220AF48|nr:Oligomerization domain-containing protein [Mucor mucedo]KAI7876651.1 Oligomerization domain-containing protein [Mucor mucedo]
MFRLARLTQQFQAPLLRKATYNQARISAPVFAWRQNFSQTQFSLSSVEKPAGEKEAEEDELEVIDPKDFPELYPTEEEEGDVEEQVDTEWFVDPEFTDEKLLSETDFIPLWQRRAVGDHLEDRLALQQVSKDLMESGKLTAETLVELLEESKMDNVQILDVREKCDWAEYMIVASSAKGDKYLSGVAEHIGGVVKKAISSNPDTLKLQPAPHIEGRNDKSGWLLIDLGRIIVHLFTPEVRERYDLEGLWKSVSTDPSEPMAYEEEEEKKNTVY